MADEIKDAVKANATGPKSARSDAGSVTQHSLKDQIEADRYLDAKDAADRRHRGLRITQMIPPGAA